MCHFHDRLPRSLVNSVIYPVERFYRVDRFQQKDAKLSRRRLHHAGRSLPSPGLHQDGVLFGNARNFNGY